MEKDELELNTKDKSIGDKLTQLESDKINLVRKLYKIDETYDIEELKTLQQSLISEKQNIESQLKDDKEYVFCLHGDLFTPFWHLRYGTFNPKGYRR